MGFSMRKAALAVISLAALAYGVSELRSSNGYAGMVEKREEVNRLERENQKLRSEISRLSKRVDDLTNNPGAQELEIRKTYNMLKPGETVYILQDKNSK